MGIPVTVIGGYLGAGKTTLVNELLRNANGRRLAVLVNEFGELPIDADLIEASDENMISIAGGCVCCSYGNDMITAMMALAKMQPQPDHVVLEASGVAIPGSIASAISLLDPFSLESVVVLANAETIRDQISDNYIGDTITRQLADADIIVLNKTDLVNSGELNPICDLLTTNSGGAAVLQCEHCRVPIDIVLQNSGERPVTAHNAATHQANLFKSHYFEMNREVDVEQLARRLASADLDLVRSKGFVKTAKGLKTLQVVGRRWDVGDAPDGASAGIVVIARTEYPDLMALQEILE